MAIAQAWPPKLGSSPFGRNGAYAGAVLPGIVPPPELQSRDLAITEILVTRTATKCTPRRRDASLLNGYKEKNGKPWAKPG